jgi:hypothetical protein
MPKVLVLFHDRDANAERLAEAAAQGARSVRFAEVEIRQLSSAMAVPATPPEGYKERPEPSGGKYQSLGSIQKLTDYDAVVLAAPRPEAAMLLTSLLRMAKSLPDVVATIVRGTTADEAGIPPGRVLEVLSDLGMILVSGGADPAHAGRRAATVAGWVRHAKGHEGGHHHHH